MHRLPASAPPRHELHARESLRRRSPLGSGVSSAPSSVRLGLLPRVAGLPRSAASSASPPSRSGASSPSCSPLLALAAVGADRGSDPSQSTAGTPSPLSSSASTIASGAGSTATVIEPTPLRRFLSVEGEREAAEVLREQFAHEKRITSDDVRYVVRVIAGHGGRRLLPPDFPPSRWILEFKRHYGFAAYASSSIADGASALATAASAAAGSHSVPPPPPSLLARRPRDLRGDADAHAGSVIARVTNSSADSSVGSDDGSQTDSYSLEAAGAPMRRRRRYGYGYGYEFGEAGPAPKMRYAVPSSPFYDAADSPTHTEDTAVNQDSKTTQASPPQQQQQQQLVPSLTTIMERRGLPWPPTAPPSIRAGSLEKKPSIISNGSSTSLSRSSSGCTSNSGSNSSSNSSRVVGNPSGPTAASSWGEASPSSTSSAAIAARILAGPLAKKPLVTAKRHGSTSSYSVPDDQQSQSSTSSDKRKYKLSHTVSPEVWEKAIAAVEQQGMSLRAAAKIYGVHFAALHRRVKKRAASGHAVKGGQGYFHPSDEAGIMRVVVARAELGVLMTFDELMELVETAALRKLPDISVEAARALMSRFQSRNEQSIRHIVADWPVPRVAPPVQSDAAIPA